MSKENDAILATIETLQKKLEAIPETDRGIRWEERCSVSDRERLVVSGVTANALKFLLDNTEAVMAGLRQVRQLHESADRLEAEANKWREENTKRFFGTIGLMFERAIEIARHKMREQELLEANSRYVLKNQELREELRSLKLGSISYTPIRPIPAALVEKLKEARNNFSSRLEPGIKSPGGGFDLPDDIAAAIKDMIEKGKAAVVDHIKVNMRPAPDVIDARDLRDILATLGSIDRREIEEAGYDMPDGSWQHFQSNPRERFLEGNDEFREAVVKVINQRRGAR